MRTVLLLVGLFLILFSKQKPANACTYNNQINFSTYQHIIKNTQSNFTNDNSNIILLEDIEFEDEYQNNNELNDYQNNTIYTKNHQFPLFWFSQNLGLAALNCYNNFSKNHSLFSANSTPIYLTIRVIRI